jgi:hypothetical protein
VLSAKPYAAVPAVCRWLPGHQQMVVQACFAQSLVVCSDRSPAMFVKYDSSSSRTAPKQLAFRSSVAAAMYATLLVNRLAPLMRHKARPIGMPNAPNSKLNKPGFVERYAGLSCRTAERHQQRHPNKDRCPAEVDNIRHATKSNMQCFRSTA